MSIHASRPAAASSSARGGRNSTDDNDPSPNSVLTAALGGGMYNPNTSSTAPMGFTALSPGGGSLPHNNLQPYLVLTFIIAMQGVFPPRG